MKQLSFIPAWTRCVGGHGHSTITDVNSWNSGECLFTSEGHLISHWSTSTSYCL